MDAKIDYFSFTLPVNLGGAGHSDEVHAFIIQQLDANGFNPLVDLLIEETSIRRSGRGHYGAGLFFQDLHISLWWGGIANHLLVEIAGVGCQAARDAGCMDQTVFSAQDRCTRIDIAIDLPDAGKPADFVSKRKSSRISAKASMESATGWTEYVGSMKSDRFARVYLYAEPHPRAGVMRVEHVLRSDYAKAACRQLLSDGMATLVTMLGNSFGWEHPRWQPDEMTEGKLKAQRHDTHGAGTLRWLAKAVAPALIKAQKDGLLDAEEWFRTHVLSELEG